MINSEFSLLNCIVFIKIRIFLTVSRGDLCSVSPDLCSLPTRGLCCPAEGCKAVVCWAISRYGKGTLVLIPATCYRLTRNGSCGYKTAVLHVCITDLTFIQWSYVRRCWNWVELSERETVSGRSVITLLWKSRQNHCIAAECCWHCHFSGRDVNPIFFAFFARKRIPSVFSSFKITSTSLTFKF